MRMAFFTLSVVYIIALAAPAFSAGHIAPIGVTTGPASQLVAWYDETEENSSFEGFSVLQVTNLSADTGVNIHVQIFADDVFENTDRCREHNFTDTLTPTDTVIYCIGNLNLDDDPTDIDGEANNWSCGGNNAGSVIPINVDETRGFVVVTAVNQVTLPRQAISHNYLVGHLLIAIGQDSASGTGSHNTMGRRAVDFATGEETPPGVLLDGITNGLQLIQPNELFFAFHDLYFSENLGLEDESNIVSINFSDNYSDPNGEYRATPSTAVWDPLMYNQFEQATSCQQHVFTCFSDIGLNDDWGTLIEDTSGTNYIDVRLCPAVSLDGDGGFSDSGWVEIAVSGLSGLDNGLGLASFFSDDSSFVIHWMHAR